MIPFQERNGSLGNTEALDKCLQAKKDLEVAFAEIVKAEQQVKDNWKEVFGIWNSKERPLCGSNKGLNPCLKGFGCRTSYAVAWQRFSFNLQVLCSYLKLAWKKNEHSCVLGVCVWGWGGV